MKDRVLVGWSGGKDSAMALYEIKRSQDAEVAALLTTVAEGHSRISMHGVPRELLITQANALGYPLHEIFIPQTCTNQIYEQRMQDALEKYQRDGISAAVFGDLFLEEIRAYREERMSRIAMRCLFPVWGRPTAGFAEEFIHLGFRAVVVCVDTKAISPDFAGREYDRSFLKGLPGNAVSNRCQNRCQAKVSPISLKKPHPKMRHEIGETLA
jgi:uncharacterized protein (TIGR00290 family)